MITIKYNTKKFECDSVTNGFAVAKEFGWETARLVAVSVNNQILSLSQIIDINCTVEPVLVNTKAGSEIYRRTLSFILSKVVTKLFPKSHLWICNSLGNGYYYTFEDETVSETQLKQIEEEMRKIITRDEKIETQIISYIEACELLEKFNRTESRKHLNFLCPPKILINKMDDFADMYTGPLVPSTAMLKTFELRKYNDGFLLRFPEANDETTIPAFVDNPKIAEIFDRYKKWGKTVHVSTVASLNELIMNRKINDFIDITETFQAQNYARVAQQIKERGNVKVVLIAGPSSSGKTTSAKKLALHLRALGYTPQVISLDNYYVGRERNPKDENGNYDYECLEALDIPLLNKDLNDLFNGKEIDVVSYDFDKGAPYYSGAKMKLSPTDILIMEGIHGLNDKLTPLVAPELKFKVYLSALTQLNIDDYNRVPTSDNRLIRRIVRDSKFRGKSAAQTISMWDSVQKGERLHIFPHQNNADAVLNTALDYELCALKVYAYPLLKAVKPTDKEYAEASRLLRFLDVFNQIPESYIPKQSIVREFIGGSSFKY